jgi:regulator of protease activity HflC (stomatin/prohibitin superfamily)
VAENYEKVNVARLHSETNRLGALQYKAGRVPRAHGLAAELLAKARSESTSKVALAKAEAERFSHQISAFKAAPSVYKTRSKLETFQQATRGARKYILSDTENGDIINLELQDKLRSDLLDVTVDQGN